MIASNWQETAASLKDALASTDSYELDHALVELCWHMLSCEEVHEAFDYYSECPVCLAREDRFGHLEHKTFSDILN